eukprot:CAMPEP_0181231670 /NCGR_PEP_ID=MMETSP1096-20121128/35250_1 /TAXON_ID=156174 ORGANISM="Chrysochromulina ericina, Strain CCMP281" /NCGR_SAMPLE_ID=MMETSP1096 /ASSEMBLY_ACC=CAM_ASM_000453 /LENGTH=38 /DNA_ID= /DNA_START= /DNA_END= /DNA_ORIENTATION=
MIRGGARVKDDSMPSLEDMHHHTHRSKAQPHSSAHGAA